jgi:hypothetical protein
MYVNILDGIKDVKFKYSVHNKTVSKQKAILDGLLLILIITSGKEHIFISIDIKIVDMISKFLLEKSERKRLKFHGK